MFAISPAQTPRRGSIMTDGGDFGFGDAGSSRREEYVEGNLSRIAYKKDRPGNDLMWVHLVLHLSYLQLILRCKLHIKQGNNNLQN